MRKATKAWISDGFELSSVDQGDSLDPAMIQSMEPTDSKRWSQTLDPVRERKIMLQKLNMFYKKKKKMLQTLSHLQKIKPLGATLNPISKRSLQTVTIITN